MIDAPTTTLTDPEIIALMGGPTAVARLLDIKAPSVHKWIAAGIPEPRLIQLGAEIEKKSKGRFQRKARWPQKYAFYWPELAEGRAAPALQVA